MTPVVGLAIASPWGAGGSEVFLYAGTEVAAWEAERVARDVLAQHHLPAEFAIHRWHPVEERWEDPDVALPGSEAEREAEHQQLLDDETTESGAAGMARWLVRAELPSRPWSGPAALRSACRWRASDRSTTRSARRGRSAIRLPAAMGNERGFRHDHNSYLSAGRTRFDGLPPGHVQGRQCRLPSSSAGGPWVRNKGPKTLAA
jgi:hypothetical protein